MIFLFLALSAASSAIQEIIANALGWRAKTLEQGIAALLQSEQFKDELYKLPLVQGLCSPNASGQLGQKPSYIASSTFALAVLQLAEQKGINLTSLANAPAVSSAIQASGNPPPGPTALLLQSLLRGAKDVDEQKRRIEDWFNNSMDRISGWYKRKSHLALWVIGVVLCVLVNADSISLANAFWTDQTLSGAAVAAATSYVQSQSSQVQAPNTGGDPFGRLNEVRTELSKVSIPLGWCWGTQPKKCFPVFNSSKTSSGPNGDDIADRRMIMSFNSGGETILWWWWKFVGIIVTALAISQGAPFWFDLLQKAVNLRLAGTVPDEKAAK
ncbi:MAG: hypothetical protein ACLQFM_09820 [Terriglobales bacterium]